MNFEDVIKDAQIKEGDNSIKSINTSNDLKIKL